MLVQYGGGILDARGSVGGQVHSRNRFGNYVRARTTPVNPNTARQAFMRAIVGATAARWHVSLTQAQRDAWDVYANAIVMTNKLGASIKLTGFNHYVRSRSFLRQNGTPGVDDGPVNLTLPTQDELFAAVVDEANQQLSVTFDDTLAWVDQDNGIMGIYMSEPQPVGTKYIRGPWRLAGTIEGDSTTAPTTPAVIAVPFPVAVGQRVGFRARICEEDGRLSGLFQGNIAITA